MVKIKDYGLHNWVDFFHKQFALSIAKKIKKYAIKRKADVIICGHTHIPLHDVFHDKKGRKIEYFNCGSWLEERCSYVTVDEHGAAELRFIDSIG